MSDVVPAFLAIILFVITLTTVAAAVIASADEIQQAMVSEEARTLPQVDTEINTVPEHIALLASSTIELTLSNDGNTSLGDFADWDVISEIRQSTSNTDPPLGLVQVYPRQ